MSLTNHITTAAQVRDAVEALAPTISARAAETEASRRVPTDLLEGLIKTGCFRLLLPASHGGVEADVPSAIRVIETLARADASVAWIVMIGGASWNDLTGLPRETFDAVFANGPDTIIAGAIAPTGVITPIGDGGYRVTGRWAFVSGCQHAKWLFVDCLEGFADGTPEMRIALLSPDQVVVEDTWTAFGLAGTASHHIRVDDVLVPAERTFSLQHGEPCVDATVAHISPPSLYSTCLAALALGIALGAIDDIVALAETKVPLLAGAPLATNPTFQLDLANADTELRAARALVYDSAESMWATAESGLELTLQQRARLRAGAVWATERAVSVVETAYRAGGGTAIYADCPLQRRLRDIHALTQHFLVRRDTLVTAGAVLAGQPVDVPVF